MVRAVDTEVQKLIGDTSMDVDLFITQASLLVDEELATLSPVQSDSRLALIETYLAAHFAVLVKERGAIASDEIEDAKERYHNVYAAGLKSTRFGQQAISMDKSGTLAKLSDMAERTNKKTALFTTLTPAGQTWPPSTAYDTD